MRTIVSILCNLGIVLSAETHNSKGPVGTPEAHASEKKSPSDSFFHVSQIPQISGSKLGLPPFAPVTPVTLLAVEPTVSNALPAAPKLIDGTEYAASKEHQVPRAKHFLRKSDSSSIIDKDRKTSQSSLDVDETEEALDAALKEGMEGLKESMDYVVSTIETLPSHPAVKDMEAQVDNWAQETKAGFKGYIERIESLWKSESKSVGNKLFEAADAYSHRFFTLLHVKESDHPVLAAKVTRIIVAMGLSLTLVFLIFGLALQLQKSIIAKAHEEAGKQEPRLRPGDDREQLFFAMPYPQTQSNGNIIVVE
jgi:hypothetical protein